MRSCPDGMISWTGTGIGRKELEGYRTGGTNVKGTSWSVWAIWAEICVSMLYEWMTLPEPGRVMCPSRKDRQVSGKTSKQVAIYEKHAQTKYKQNWESEHRR